MQRYFDVVQTQTGRAINGASVSVYDSNGNLATLYSDDGVTLENNPLTTNADGEYGFYAANGTYSIVITATGYAGQTLPGVILFDPNGATIEATSLNPDNSYAIGTTVNAGNVFRVFQNTTTKPNQNVVAQIRRTVDDDEGFNNPKALMAYTIVNVNSSQTEWALSAELDNYSNTGSNGNAASSGVANKYGLATVFAGHFQTQDHNTYNSSLDTTPAVGVEINMLALGPDHPTLNTNLGGRLTMDIIAKNNTNTAPTWSDWAATTAYDVGDIVVPTTAVLSETYDGFYYVCSTAGTSGSVEPVWPTTVNDTIADGTVVWTAYRGAELGCGIRIRNETGSPYGHFRVGMQIQDDLSGVNPNRMVNGLVIRTGGANGIRMVSAVGLTHSTADILLEQDSSYGLICNGSYTNAAIRVGNDQFIGLRASNAAKFRFNVTTARVEWYSAGTMRAELEIDATPRLLFNGVQIIQDRETGWTAMTGSSNKASVYDTSTVTLPQLAGRVMALQAALTTHGLIGT